MIGESMMAMNRVSRPQCAVCRWRRAMTEEAKGREPRS
jgi:hypothetical protein